MIRRCPPLIVLLFAFASPAEADTASEELLRSFVEGIDAAPGWSASVDVIRSERDDTIGEGIRFTHESSESSGSIDQLRLSRLDATDGGGFTASLVEMQGAELQLATNIEGADQTIVYTVRTALVTDLSVPKGSNFVLDPRRPMRSIGEFYTLIAAAEFEAVSVPEVSGSQTVAINGENESLSTFAFHNLGMQAMRDGILGGMLAGPYTFDMATPTGEAVSFEIAQVSAGEMDIGALAEIVDPRAYENGRGDGEWRSLASDITYSGLTGSGPEGITFGLGSISLSGFEGRQPQKPVGTAFDKLLDPSLSQQEKDEAGLEAALALLSAWRLEGFAVGDLTVEVPREQASFELGSFSIAQISNEGIERVALSDIHGSGPGGFGSLDQLEVTDFVFLDLRKMMEIGKAIEESGNPSPAQVRGMGAAMPKFGRVRLRGFAGGASPAEAVTFASMALRLEDWTTFFATFADFQLTDLEVPREILLRNPKLADTFRALGFERVVFDMATRSQWSPDDATYAFRLSMSVDNGASIDVGLTLTGITDGWIDRVMQASQAEDNDAAMQALVEELGLVRATFTVNDDSLVDRSFAAAVVAQNLDVDPATYKQQFRDALPILMSTIAPPELVQRIGPPVHAFLAGGRKIVVDIAPAEPILLRDLPAKAADPGNLADDLRLSITTE